MDKSLLTSAIHAYYVSLTNEWYKRRMNLSESSYAIFLSTIEEYIMTDYIETDRADLADWFKRNGWQVTKDAPYEGNYEITHRRR